MTVNAGDALLYAASAARDMTWETFRRIVDATCVPDGKLAAEMRYVRTEAVDVGDVLGHWEVVHAGAERKIVVAPPVLARLPWPGLPRAVLCGSRSPDTLADICQACDAFDGLSLSISAQPHHPYAPMRIELSAESEEHLIAVGREMSVRYDPIPAAWAIAQASGSVGRYLSALAWEKREDLNWDRREFDPDLLRFRSSAEGIDLSRLRLISYAHPNGWAWRDWLCNNGLSADVDRSWGRYCVLAAVGRTVMRYDHREGVATVPRQVPLPKLLARALALSSGNAPNQVPDTGLGLRAYHSVPLPVFEEVAAKLHQNQHWPLSGEKGQYS